jgi:hypothetical protein
MAQLHEIFGENAGYTTQLTARDIPPAVLLYVLSTVLGCRGF